MCMCVCVCVPGYQEQRDARSQTYEEAIVHEHFAPVTSARQWPPLTRPVTVSLFADNAWKYAETHAGYPWFVDSRFPLIRAPLDRAEKTRGAPVNRRRFRSLGNRTVSYLTPTFFASSTNRKTGPSSPSNDYYRPFRHSRETYNAANCCDKMKRLFLSYIIMLTLMLEKIKS